MIFLQVPIPKFPASFVGTGDLFTALCTGWLTKSGGDLKVTLEKTIDTMQSVLQRTLDHAWKAAKLLGEEKPLPSQMELKLIQSLEAIQNPPSGTKAVKLKDEVL